MFRLFHWLYPPLPPHDSRWVTPTVYIITKIFWHRPRVPTIAIVVYDRVVEYLER